MSTKVKKEKKPMKKTTKLLLLQIFGFIVLLSPVVTIFIINRENYFTYKESFKMSFGCVIGLIVTFLMIKGKTTLFQGNMGIAVVFVLSYFLDQVLQDLTIISGCALIGSVLYTIFFRKRISRLKRLIAVEEDSIVKSEQDKKTAQIIADAINGLNGRV